MSELTATQKGARLMARLLMHGPVRAHDEAKRLSVTPARVYQILNDLSALHEVPMTNDRGWWYVEWLKASEYDQARALLARVKEELEAADDAAFCRPMPRTHMVAIKRLLERMVEGNSSMT
jgi:hypothetical protein